MKRECVSYFKIELWPTLDYRFMEYTKKSMNKKKFFFSFFDPLLRKFLCILSNNMDKHQIDNIHPPSDLNLLYERKAQQKLFKILEEILYGVLRKYKRKHFFFLDPLENDISAIQKSQCSGITRAQSCCRK